MTQNALNNTASVFDVDNLNLDGNTISSTDTNGNIIIDPDGTGVVVIGDASSSNYISQLRSASGQWLNWNDATDSFGFYNNAGTPEGVITADIGSLCTDTTNGTLYVKQTDSANTGWTTVGGLPGEVVQTVVANSATFQTSTVGMALIPSDDTFPQQTEGVEHLTASITPTSSANTLRINFNMMLGNNNVLQTLKACLFQDSTADAIYTTAASNVSAIYAVRPVTGTIDITAGTTSSTTFKIRIGTDAASGQAAVNGTSLGRQYGGSSITTLKIEELQV